MRKLRLRSLDTKHLDDIDTWTKDQLIQVVYKLTELNNVLTRLVNDSLDDFEAAIVIQDLLNK